MCAHLSEPEVAPSAHEGRGRSSTQGGCGHGVGASRKGLSGAWSPGKAGVVLSPHVPPHLEEASVSAVSVPVTLAQSVFLMAR